MALQPSLHYPLPRPNRPPFPLTPKTTSRLIAAAAGGSDSFPFCPVCGGYHSEAYDCRKRVQLPHPERLTPKFQRSQERLFAALCRHSRAGCLPCPRCNCRIAADDLGLDRQNRALPLRRSAFAFSEGGAQ